MDYNNENYRFYQNKTLKGFIEDNGSTLTNRMNFTGQHRCLIKDIPYSNTYCVDRIVCANQNICIYIYINTMKTGNQAITQNEALPYVSICNKTNVDSCFGIISFGEDPIQQIDRHGAFLLLTKTEKNTHVFT
jgi:hypothetical protein